MSLRARMGMGLLLGLLLLPSAAQAVCVAHVCPIHSGDDLQAALDAAVGGDTFLLDAGAVFQGPFRLNPIASATPATPITVRTATPDGTFPGPGVRVAPANAALMPKFLTEEFASNTGGLQITALAHDWIVIGIEIKRQTTLVPDAGSPPMGMVEFSWPSDNTQQPVRIVLDRLYVHGNPGDETRSGINVYSGANVTIKNSYVTDIHQVGFGDTNALFFLEGSGPYLIDNNYLASAGENVLLGGALSYGGKQPEHLTFTHNTIAKDPSWKFDDPSFYTPATIVPGLGHYYATKNCFEFKSGAHAVIEGNIFEHCFAQNSDQQGAAVLFTIWQSSGTDCGGGYQCNEMPQNDIYDIVFRNNIIRSSNKAIAIRARQGVTPPPINISRDLHFINNLIYDIGGPRNWTNRLSSGTTFEVGYGPDNLEIVHNTIFPDSPRDQNSFVFFYDTTPDVYPATNVTIRDNIMDWSAAPFANSTGGVWPAIYNMFNAMTGLVFHHNVWLNLTRDLYGYDCAALGTGVGGGQTDYCNDAYVQYFPTPDTPAGIGWVNVTTGDEQLNPGVWADFNLRTDSPYHAGNAFQASDGTDIGANITALMTVIGGGAPAVAAAPTVLVATPVSGTAITLTWTDNATTEDSFKTERALGAGAFSQVGVVGANVTTYADSGLTASTLYSYRVRASNTGGDSAYTNTATAAASTGISLGGTLQLGSGTTLKLGH